MKKIILFAIALQLFACKSGNENQSGENIPEPGKEGYEAYEVKMPEQEPIYYEGTDNLDTSHQIMQIRKRFGLISAKKAWDSIVQRDIRISTEGGWAKYYFNNNDLQKIDARFFSETNQQLHEYYFVDSTLSFVYEKIEIYNRPIYWDSNAMKESNDNQIFDKEKSTFLEVRSYFSSGGELILLLGEDGIVRSGLDKEAYAKNVKDNYRNLMDALLQEE